MPWHPPIPAGRLYSEDALRLGPGIALLAWCYDRINRDGTIEVQLRTAATDIGKPYGTIKDWWRLLREGPFFCEQIDRGKSGWVVRLDDEWIDWHVMTNNYPVQGRNVSLEDVPSSPGEGRDVNVEDVQVSVKSPSRRRQGRDVNLKKTAYKEDHRSMDPDRAPRKNAGAPHPKNEHTNGIEPTPHQAIMRAYSDALGYPMKDGPAAGVAAKWLVEHGYTAEQVAECYRDEKARDFWKGKHLSLQSLAKCIGAWAQARQKKAEQRTPEGWTDVKDLKYK